MPEKNLRKQSDFSGKFVVEKKQCHCLVDMF